MSDVSTACSIFRKKHTYRPSRLRMRTDDEERSALATSSTSPPNAKPVSSLSSRAAVTNALASDASHRPPKSQSFPARLPFTMSCSKKYTPCPGRTT